MKKCKFAKFSVLNLEIWNSNLVKSWRRSQWIENKSREYLEITNFPKKEDPKGLNTLFVKISTFICEKREECPIFDAKSWNFEFQLDEKLKKKTMNRK